MKLQSIAALAASFLLVLASEPGRGQAADNYNTSKAVTLKGTVRGLSIATKVICLLLDVPDTPTTSRKWVIEGASLSTMRAEGWMFARPGTLKPGDNVRVSVYFAKPGSKARDALLTASPQIADELKDAQLARGVEVTLPDGRKLAFGPSNRTSGAEAADHD